MADVSMMDESDFEFDAQSEQESDFDFCSDDEHFLPPPKKKAPAKKAVKKAAAPKAVKKKAAPKKAATKKPKKAKAPLGDASNRVNIDDPADDASGAKKDNDFDSSDGKSLDSAEKSDKPKKTIEQVYQKKTQLEHILLRPDTYSK